MINKTNNPLDDLVSKTCCLWYEETEIKKIEPPAGLGIAAELFEWEKSLAGFKLNEGKLQPAVAWKMKDGSEVHSPSLSDFNEERIEYLKKRAAETTNLHLKIRYNQILWNCPKPYKSNVFLQRATEASLEFLSSCLEQSPESLPKDNEHLYDLAETVVNLGALTFYGKYKQKEASELLRKFIESENALSEYGRMNIINWMLATKGFPASELVGYDTIIEKIVEQHQIRQTDYFSTKGMLQTGLKLAQKTKADVKPWNLRIGEALVNCANKRMNDESRLAPLIFLQESIGYFKAAGNERRLLEVMLQFSKVKTELKLNEVTYEMPENDAILINEEINNNVEFILSREPKEIFGILALGDFIFPTKEYIETGTKRQKESFLDFISGIEFDINHNFSKQKEGEKKLAKFYSNYGFHMQYTYPLLYRLFVRGVEQGKIDFGSVINYWIEDSWFSQTLIRYDSGNNPHDVVVAKLIGPSFLLFFEQLQGLPDGYDEIKSSLILNIDSLATKFEGVLRILVKHLGQSTTSVSGTELHERFLEDMLNDPILIGPFTENDIVFFKYIFTSHGLNIRNNVAHGFYHEESYTLEKLFLLVCAFLRLGKFRFETEII